MATNPYFNTTHSLSEQRLMEDIFVETIQMFGTDAYYVPRNDVNTDLVYGEDPLKSFNSYYPIEVFNKDTTNFEGQQEIFSKFGLEIKDDYTVIMSRKSFKQFVRQNSNYNRPKEGDLLYIPHVSLGGMLYEITWVEPDSDMFLLGRKYPYYYEMKLEPFKYSEEIIQTGNEDIDSTVFEEAYTVNLLLGSGSGQYSVQETIYQGTTFNTSVARGFVSSWNNPTHELKVTNVNGVFIANTQVKGITSGSSYNLISYDLLQNNLDRAFDNEVILSEGNTYISFSETNPFGEV